MSGDPSFFDGLGADDAHLRDTMARFHTDLAQTSQAHANIAGQQVNDFGYRSVSYSRASAQAAADAAKRRESAHEYEREANERVEGITAQRHRENAKTHLRQMLQHEQSALREEGRAQHYEKFVRQNPGWSEEEQDLAQQHRTNADEYRQQMKLDRELAQQELDAAQAAKAGAPAVRAQAQKLRAEADELDARSQQLAEQAKQARSQGRTLLNQQTSAVGQHDQSQQRAQTYQGCGAGRVVYDHAGIEAAIAELQQILDRAQANLETCRQARRLLAQDAAGAAADASNDNLLQLERINQHIIETVRAALRDLGVANYDMAHLEQHNASQYH